MKLKMLFFILLLVFGCLKAQYNSPTTDVNRNLFVYNNSLSNFKKTKPTAFGVRIEIKNRSKASGSITVRLQRTDKLTYYSKTIKIKNHINSIKFKKVPKGVYQILIFMNNKAIQENELKVIFQSFYVHSDITKIILL